ncbi:MAG: LysR family transcriptional regulator [Microbacterium sp.]
MTDAPDFDIQSLRIVRAISDTGSITAAAAALGYSQPAVSQHVHLRLETRLGVAILERVGRGVRLTEAGRVLARHAQAVTVAIDAAAEELAELRGLRTGLVRLVAPSSPVLVPRLIAALATSHPGITLTISKAEPPEAVEAIREDRADIALTFESYPSDP